MKPMASSVSCDVLQVRPRHKLLKAPACIHKIISACITNAHTHRMRRSTTSWNLRKIFGTSMKKSMKVASIISIASDFLRTNSRNPAPAPYLPYIPYLLHQLLIIMRQQLRIHLPDDLHDDADDNDHSGTGDEQVLRRERGVLGKDKRQYTDKAQEHTSPQV